MMRLIFNQDDWFGRHPDLCLVLAGTLILVESAL